MKGWIPVSHIPLMHKLDTLDEQPVNNQHDGRQGNSGHLAYLSEKCNKFAKGLKLRAVERAQKREHH
jgi:hypothetical protein